MKIKFWRVFTEDEYESVLGSLVGMKSNLEAMGCKVNLNAWKEIEVDEADISRGEGKCSDCRVPTVQVKWSETMNDTDIEFMGLACPKCKNVLEYAGVGTGPVDLDKWLGM